VHGFNFWLASAFPTVNRVFKTLLGKNANAFTHAEQQHVDTISKYVCTTTRLACVCERAALDAQPMFIHHTT
jgi:hypothetical protein